MKKWGTGLSLAGVGRRGGPQRLRVCGHTSLLCPPASPPRARPLPRAPQATLAPPPCPWPFSSRPARNDRKAGCQHPAACEQGPPERYRLSGHRPGSVQVPVSALLSPSFLSGFIIFSQLGRDEVRFKPPASDLRPGSRTPDTASSFAGGGPLLSIHPDGMWVLSVAPGAPNTTADTAPLMPEAPPHWVP